MRAVVVVVAVLLMGALRPEAAHAWATANRWGGSTSHTWGATSHTNAWGGSSSHAYGVGTEHTNMPTAAVRLMPGTAGLSTPTLTAAVPMARTGQGQPTPTPLGRPLITRLPTVDIPPITRRPTVMPAITRLAMDTGIPPITHRSRSRHYSASGCLGCAVAAGAVVGATVGAVAASANTAAAYSSGYTAGNAAGYAMGVNYAALPTGCAYQAGPNEYLCGGSWFRPAYGANGLYYTVVPAP